MNFFVKSFGCRTNQAELQKWIQVLESRGYNYSRNISNSRFGIYNTCSLTRTAESKTFRDLKKQYRRYPDIPCVVTGCTVTRDRDRLAKDFPGYIFLTNREKTGLVDEVANHFPNPSNLIYHSIYRSRYFLKIQDGCDFTCSYCIIPALRGKSRSVPVSTLTKEVETVSRLGYREVVLTGINISSYGNDFYPRENLLDLIDAISSIDRIQRIRISSLDPRTLNYTFIRRISLYPKVAKNFHLSFQSGSNRILRQMKRSQKRSDYYRIMRDFTALFPQANFGADLIVGYPGEKDRDFLDTLEFAGTCGLNYLHIFPFSPMEGTKASQYPPVPNHILMPRIRKMHELNRRLKLDYRERMRNTVWDAVVVEEKPSSCQVLTDNFLKVSIDGLCGLKKRIIPVRIKGIIDENTCRGEWV